MEYVHIGGEGGVNGGVKTNHDGDGDGRWVMVMDNKMEKMKQNKQHL